MNNLYNIVIVIPIDKRLPTTEYSDIINYTSFSTLQSKQDVFYIIIS